MVGLRRHIRRFVRGEEATATIEFVFLFPVIMMLFVASFETSMIMTRQVMLERTLDQAVRILRLAQGVSVSTSDIKDSICSNTQFLPNCETLLTVDMRRVDRTTYALPPTDDICASRGEEVIAYPSNSFEVGVDNDLMLVRVCMLAERIVPLSGIGLNLTRDSSGALHMMAASIFVNEPD